MKLTDLRKIAAAAAFIGFTAFAVMSCGDKKEAKSQEAAASQENAENQEEAVEIKIVKTKDPNPSTDFIYETTVDGTGVVIQKYIGSRGNVIIPEEIEGLKVKTIGAGSFQELKNIASVSLPAFVKSIEASAFRNSSLSEVTLNSGLQTIAASAFRGSKLKSVEIPAGFEKFTGGYQFYESALEKVSIPQGLASIPEGCFASTKLSSVEFPEGIVSIADSAFSDCEISSFNIPSSLKSTGSKAFSGNPLKEVSIAARTAPVTYGWNTFADCNGKGTMTIALRKSINSSGYRNTYYEKDVSGCWEPKK